MEQKKYRKSIRKKIRKKKSIQAGGSPTHGVRTEVEQKRRDGVFGGLRERIHGWRHGAMHPRYLQSKAQKTPDHLLGPKWEAENKKVQELTRDLARRAVLAQGGVVSEWDGSKYHEASDLVGGKKRKTIRRKKTYNKKTLKSKRKSKSRNRKKK